MPLPAVYALKVGEYRIRNRENPHAPKQCVLELKDGDAWRDLEISNDVDSLVRSMRERDHTLHQLDVPYELYDAAKVAAKWWADVLYEGAKKDNGDAVQSMFAAVMLGDKFKPSREAADKFELLLARFITRQLTIGLNNGYCGDVGLSVDYHPDWNLRIIGDYCGISDSAYPWKTNMHVSLDHVVLRYGYHAPEEMLYGTPVVHEWRFKEAEVRYPDSEWSYLVHNYECVKCGRSITRCCVREQTTPSPPGPRAYWTTACVAKVEQE